MFLTTLCLVEDQVPDSASADLWFVDAPLVWKDALYGTLTVPQGFRTDLASIPRALRNLPFLDPNGISRRPAVMHDWLYAWQAKGKDFADNFLRAALLAEGASESTAGAFYYGVHLFGRLSWDSDTHKFGPGVFQPGPSYANWRSTPDGWGSPGVPSL